MYKATPTAHNEAVGLVGFFHFFIQKQLHIVYWLRFVIPYII
jgi:hypothetical protein